MLSRVSSALVLGLLGLFVGGAALADDVHLKNGRKFEGVIAEVTDSQVRIRMQGGVLSLPKSQVLRVEERDSDLSGYLRRKEALERSADTRAQDWLDLARWAKTHGLEQGAREAALEAAEIEPKLEGLALLLRGFRYTFDEQLGRWISYEESMRRRGFVFTGGAWISREELAERNRQREAEVARRRSEAEAARAERTARQTELLLATQTALLEETLRERERAPYVSPYVTPYNNYGWPVVIIPGFFPPRCHKGSCEPTPGGDGRGDGHRPSHRPDTRNTFTRIPGSLIPGEPGGMRSSSSSPDR
jgi:hypothetical protein